MIIILSVCVILVIIGIIIICFSYFFKFDKIEFDEFKEDEFEDDESDEDFYKLLGSTKHILNMVGVVFIVIGITLFFLYKYF